ncbi:helix-turn-helix transcriptional regulator [Trinickia caryophylli]|uniref:Transcriptional regulator, ArsR family n=1 Tax=Trinickia caryophylli TaxID=28094 RepID=A0A1X7DU50_TRICW|nr:helix-turn-helix transcriptional regulator [Trinickia caryophylli]PMS08788.1 transcriptional regulator [Trinickia caryophylli]TRX18025.1 helix-turn-helix transcriptional regulator [Trinickia caryophylli]WQE11194.1 helix-turn-helix transcriptional regulator [Trinickia caryophylli]SMF21527.1 transcriptional regulator, ArsR family [Trinickia caryophylli]GLU32338.1 transcriptional regulator [Trinickia caryophylli]
MPPAHDHERDASHFPGLSRIGALLADPGRAAMLWALMDGSARPAGELTVIAGLSPSAASGHLARLTEGGLLSLEARGRHRYYRIATPEVATAIEALAHLAQASAPARPALRPARTVPLDLRFARTCYDHMAGELAVRLFDRLVARGWLAEHDGEIETTEAGNDVFARWGIDLARQRARRRRFACTCLDWSERRAHLGGALGAALFEHWCAQGCVEQTTRPRVLRITPAGHRSFEAILAP